MNLSQETLQLFKKLRKDVTTQGLTTGTGLNFFYLEPVAKNIYPVFYPLLASTPRVNPMFGGMRVGGTAVNWKAIVAIDPGGYPGVSEGNRNSFMSMTERNYASTYKFLGKDNQVSFQAQQTGLGFDDNVALAQLGMLNALLNDEERMLLYGNSGPASVGGNGYALGTTPTPTATIAVGVGTMTTGKTVYCFCVALTPWGVQFAGPTGVKLPFNRKNADSSVDLINGGTGVISAVSSTSAATTGANLGVTFAVAPVVGAVAYAWYVNNVDNTTANAYFAGISSVPSFLNLVDPITTNQKANAVDPGTGLGLTTDNSYNLLDFDGIMTWHFGTSGASQAAYLSDLKGAGLTSNGDGSIAEFEAVADYLWNNFKVTPDKIYTGGNLIQSVSKAILTANAGPGAQRIVFESNAAGTLTGGTKVAQYRWKYSNYATGVKVLDVMTHPWLPQGVILFDITTNPYPAAGNTIPAVRRIVSLEDHFSIKWPYRKLQHELGVYCFETLEHYIPFAGAVLTGVANKVN